MASTPNRSRLLGGGLGTAAAGLRASSLVSATDLPVLAGALTGRTVTRIAVGTYHSCALDSQGLAYCWGANFHGQLGDGLWLFLTGSSQPVAVDMSGALAGKTLVEIAVGEYHSCASTPTGWPTAGGGMKAVHSASASSGA